MSSNAKIVLRKKPNKKGQYPLAVRITKNRQSNYHYIGHYINLKHWDEKNIRVRKSHPNAAVLNSLLAHKLSEATKMLIDLQSKKKTFQQIILKRNYILFLKLQAFFK